MANTSDIIKYLKYIDFPADLTVLIEHAKENSVPLDILDMLRIIPQKMYQSLSDIEQEVLELVK